MTNVYEFAAVTPRENPASFSVREGTNDQSTVQASVTQDEYGLKDIYVTGTAVDVGAYIGSVSVALALDNPGCKVIAVEALPVNVEMAQRNVDRNGVGDRVTVLERAAAAPGKRTTDVKWNFSDNESGQHHRFVGNAQWIGAKAGETARVKCIDLGQLVAMAGGHIPFLKIDCEGGEYQLFQSDALREVGTIKGEYHDGYQRLVRLLEPTHEVTRTDGSDHFGSFTAVRK